jgi:AbrB family looped-hinge helix DNA binding protein
VKGVVMALSTLTSKGQVTIPAEIRQQLHLVTGDKLDFSIQDQEKIVVLPRKRTLSDLYGIVSSPSGPLSIEEIDEAIGQALAADDARIKREYNAIVNEKEAA